MELGLITYDWLKVDSKGSDLRIIKSLSESTFNNLLAVDFEPSFIDTYKGEDLFAESHAFLAKNDFWLCDLHIHSYARIRSESVKKLIGLTGSENTDFYLHKSPTCGEGRYLRTTEFLEKRSYELGIIISFVFCLTNYKLGYAYDIQKLFKRKFGDDSHMVTLMNESIKYAAAKLIRSNQIIPHNQLGIKQAARSLVGSIFRKFI